MIPTLLRRLISEPSEQLLDELVDDHESVFWVDHREDDEAIVRYCEDIIHSRTLSASWIDRKLFLSYGDRRAQVPLSESPDDRHITLVALNSILSPDFEIRLLWDSTDGDTLAFAVLRPAEWGALERDFGARKVNAAFMRLSDHPNVFTEALSRPSTKPWWRIF